jgi:hypothetical protein
MKKKRQKHLQRFLPLEDGKHEQEENKKFQREGGYFVGISMARNQHGSCSKC